MSEIPKLVRTEMQRTYLPPPGKIVCMRDGKKKETKGGMVIPESAQVREFYATVLAVGPDLKDVYRVGDRIVWGGMYQMLAPDGREDEGVVVLRHPEEIMYAFKDYQVQVTETDEEHKARVAELEAIARRVAERQGKLDDDTDRPKGPMLVLTGRDAHE